MLLLWEEYNFDSNDYNITLHTLKFSKIYKSNVLM